MNYTEKNKLVDNLCGAALMALLVEIFYGMTDASYTTFRYNLTNVTNTIYAIGWAFLIIAIWILIVSYKKEKGTLALYGIEFLVLAISAGLYPGTYIDFPFPYNKLNIVIPILFGFYYIIKTLLIISKRNKSNAILLGLIEILYTSIFAYGLYSLNKIIFIGLSVVTVAGFIYAMIKKSKFVLVHALEIMIIAFSMLLITTGDAAIFFSAMTCVYYIVKSIFIAINKTNTKARKAKNLKKAKRR